MTESSALRARAPPVHAHATPRRARRFLAAPMRAPRLASGRARGPACYLCRCCSLLCCTLPPPPYCCCAAAVAPARGCAPFHCCRCILLLGCSLPFFLPAAAFRLGGCVSCYCYALLLPSPTAFASADQSTAFYTRSPCCNWGHSRPGMRAHRASGAPTHALHAHVRACSRPPSLDECWDLFSVR